MCWKFAQLYILQMVSQLLLYKQKSILAHERHQGKKHQGIFLFVDYSLWWHFLLLPGYIWYHLMQTMILDNIYYVENSMSKKITSQTYDTKTQKRQQERRGQYEPWRGGGGLGQSLYFCAFPICFSSNYQLVYILVSTLT